MTAYRRAWDWRRESAQRREVSGAGELLQAIVEFRFALGLEMEILVPEIEKGKLLQMPSKEEAERP